MAIALGLPVDLFVDCIGLLLGFIREPAEVWIRIRRLGLGFPWLGLDDNVVVVVPLGT
jgi:hypothetical protein